MHKYIFLFSAIILALDVAHLSAQQPTQSIKGIVTDAMSGAPIPFATVVVLKSNPVIGATTSNEGHFQLSLVPVGRHDIQVSFIGYEPILIKEVVVTSSKEVYLEVVLRESTYFLDEVVVRPSVSKEQPLNTMATVSARMLSVEEASRYAGGFDDPARLASAFAGVASDVGNNGIVIRGNAPRMLQWKMEGVEIPNPNHFADLNSFGGGGLTALSSNLLANSDFFTGAFPAEYNNALSGVFDIFMRKGTSNDYEHSVQLGLIGIDAASEGPLRRNGNASYLFNYRYSTLGLVQQLLPEDAEKITYQDVSFKLHFPTKNAGSFSVWGIGLMDQSGQTAKIDSSLWVYMQDREEGSPKQYMGAGGLNHVYFFNTNTQIKTTVAATVSGLDWNMKRLNNQLELLPQSDIQSVNQHLVFTSAINKKFNATHTNKTGITITGMWYDLLLNEVINEGENPTAIVDDSGKSALISGFTSSTTQITDHVTLNLGLTGQLFTLNNNFSIEPRAGIKWMVNENQSISMAYGLHSRLEKMAFYLTRSSQTGEHVNKDLDFSKAHHFVVSYDYRLTENLVLKLEPYYQWLFDVPVTSNGTFSFINLQDEWFFDEPLINEGNGRNYGLDATLEKYVSQGYYFMITTSFFRSEYRGNDRIWRNTAFNREFLFNILGGKEWGVGRNKQNVFAINLRAAIQGGDPYTPVNESASLFSESIVLDETNAYTMKNDPSFVFHFTTSYTINKQNSTQEISFKILNTTMQDDFFGFRYNFQTNSVEKHLEAIIIPNLSYKISF